MLVDSRNMEVKALIGSGNYFDAAIHGQVNGTRAKRSPGSALKPFIYALALDQGIIHPYTVLKDVPSCFAEYNPENFDRDFLGPLKAKEALILSRNIPAIFLASQLKNPTLYQFLQQAQVRLPKAESTYGLSLVLGSAEVTMEELVALYAMLANQGLWQPLRTCLNQPMLEGRRLLSPEASFLTLDMLRDTPRPYLTRSSIDKQFPAYWKTGTSSSYRDAWSVGLFGPYILAVWIGDFKGTSNPAFVGTTSAAPLFFNLIDAISKHAGPLPDLVIPTPEMNLTKVKVCETSGLLPNPCCPTLVDTWFIPGKSPIKIDPIHRSESYEFWSSDLLKIFDQAGMSRSIPPSTDHLQGEPPQIISPQQDLCYTVRLNKPENKILFSAIADADVTTLYWFVDNQFIGSCERDQPLTWQARPGTRSVRVVDNHGRTSTRPLTIKAL
jgi:penicillin-binding protein 1C